MAMNKLSVRYSVTGDVAIRRLLRQLPKTMARQAAQRGVREAVQDITKEEKVVIPVEEGFLKKAIGYKVKAMRSGLGYFGLVGARKDAKGAQVKKFTHYAVRRSQASKGKQKILPYKYFHLVEGGTRPHAIGKGSSLRSGVQHGQMHPGARAQPTLRTTAARMQTNSINRIATNLARWIAAHKQGQGRP